MSNLCFTPVAEVCLVMGTFCSPAEYTSSANQGSGKRLPWAVAMGAKEKQEKARESDPPYPFKNKTRQIIACLKTKGHAHEPQIKIRVIGE